MRRMTKAHALRPASRRRSVMWTVLAVAAILAAGSALAAPLAVPTAGQQRDRYPAERMESFDAELAGGGTLRVRVDDADVRVGATSNETATVDLSLRSNDMDWARELFVQMDFRVRRDGDVLAIESDRRRRGSWGRGDRWLQVIVDVRLPRRFDLDIETGDGDVEVETARGDIRVETGDGDIDLGTIEGDEIHLRTHDGDIRGQLVRGGRVSVDSSDGDLDLGTVTGDATLHTSDGDIRIDDLASSSADLDTSDGDVQVRVGAAMSLEIESGDGDITIAVPRETAASLSLSAESIEIDPELMVTGRVRDSSVEGTINGGGPRIRARTGDGDLRIVLRNDS